MLLPHLLPLPLQSLLLLLPNLSLKSLLQHIVSGPIIKVAAAIFSLPHSSTMYIVAQHFESRFQAVRKRERSWPIMKPKPDVQNADGKLKSFFRYELGLLQKIFREIIDRGGIFAALV